MGFVDNGIRCLELIQRSHESSLQSAKFQLDSVQNSWADSWLVIWSWYRRELQNHHHRWLWGGRAQAIWNRKALPATRVHHRHLIGISLWSRNHVYEVRQSTRSNSRQMDPNLQHPQAGSPPAFQQDHRVHEDKWGREGHLQNLQNGPLSIRLHPLVHLLMVDLCQRERVMDTSTAHQLRGRLLQDIFRDGEWEVYDNSSLLDSNVPWLWSIANGYPLNKSCSNWCLPRCLYQRQHFRRASMYSGPNG